MRISESERLIREYFDISDKATRMLILDEGTDNEQLLSALTNALYDKIVANVDKIDFGSIPRSRGDITKVEGFDNTVQCLDIMRKIVIEYNESPAIVDNVLTAIDNIKTRKAQFIKAYSTSTEFPMVLYNLIVLSIEQSVSFLISVCIQYIKDPESGSIKAALDKVAYNNTKDNMLYEQLAKFNAGCKDGQIDTAINEVYKVRRVAENTQVIKPAGTDVTITIDTPSVADRDKDDTTTQKPEDLFGDDDEKDVQAIDGCGNPANVPMPINGNDTVQGVKEPLSEELALATTTGIAIAGGIAAGAAFIKYGLIAIKSLLGCAIPILRGITYFFIHSRVRVSDALAIQAQFLEANVSKLQYSDVDMTDEKKKKVIDKQIKLAEKLKRWSNKLAIDNKKSERDAQSDMSKENKKTKAGDLNGSNGNDDDMF